MRRINFEYKLHLNRDTEDVPQRLQFAEPLSFFTIGTFGSANLLFFVR